MNEELAALPPAKYLERVKPLTLTQYDEAKAATLTRVQKRIGEKPTRKKLKRDQGSLFSPLDILALVVFLAALLVSSLHIITHMGSLAQATYVQMTNAGIYVSPEVYAVAHQLGFIFLAEASMLLFMVTWRMQTRETVGYFLRLIPRKLLSVYLVLSLVAMGFVLSANLESGLTWLEAIMPPVFTIGLGFHVEHLVVEMLDRRSDLNQRLLEKLQIWEAATEDPTQHPEYRQLLLREIWEKMSRLAANKDVLDVPGSHKLAAVYRELKRDEWTAEAVDHEEQVKALVEQTGAAPAEVENLVLNDADLYSLADLVQNSTLSDVGDPGVIQIPAGSADLKHLTWTDAAQGHRQYGPYTSQQKMALAIRSVANTNQRRKN